MAKIIDVTGEKIVIGKENGEITEVRLSDIKFAPAIGDEVEVFEREGKAFVLKKENSNTLATPNGGININLTNSQAIGSNASQGYAQPGQIVVKKTVYVLLALFLGALGAHKFYAGKSGAGILYLLLCWTGISAFLAFIDFIVGLTKRADSNGNIAI